MEEEWPLLEGVLEEAVGRLQPCARRRAAMAHELLQHRDHIAAQLPASANAPRRSP